MNESKFICVECKHFYDPTDDRAVAYPGKPDLNSCPLCKIYRSFGSDRQWATYNDCNGVFDVFHYRSDADAALKEFEPECECRVVPVLVVTDHGDNFDMRDWDEAEREKYRG
jgi:hypothetical protein